MVTAVREEHLRNALVPMLVTPSEIVTAVREEQLLNAKLPMLVTLYSVLSLVTVAGMFTSPASALS